MADPNEKQSRLVRALDVFGNLFILNVLFVATCIPVITIGASLSALYSMTLKMVRKEETAIARGYFDAFKANFKQATLSWLCVLGVLVIMAGEWLYAVNYGGGLGSMYLVIIGIEAVVLLLELSFLFPLIARYENTFMGTIKNAFLVALGNLWSTAKILVAWGLPIGLMVTHLNIFFFIWYLWVIILFALIAWGTSFTIRKTFDKMDGESEDKSS